jgi:methionyl-tRNA formyltransferase
MGADLLLETLAQIDSILPEKQDNAAATYAPILKKEDGAIDWNRPAREIHNRIRGLQPWPGAFSSFRGQTLHVWNSAVTANRSPYAPGTLLLEHRHLYATAGDGLFLELREVQLEGRKRLPGEIFSSGARLHPQEVLGESKH